jgi:hypothetical protein
MLQTAMPELMEPVEIRTFSQPSAARRFQKDVGARIEGRTVAIEYRWAEGRSERYAEIAAEFG